MMELQGAIDRGKNRERKARAMVQDDHNFKQAKRLELSLTKPSFLLKLGSENIRKFHRQNLELLVRKLMRQHKWVEACGALSVLLKGTCKDKSPKMNQFKYSASIELLKQVEQDSLNPKRIKDIYDIWMKKNGSMTDWPVKDRFAVHLEFILFCLEKGDIDEAYQAALCLMQQDGYESDSKSCHVIGLTFYRLWYTTIPKEMHLDPDQPCTPKQPDMFETRSNNIAGYLQHDNGGYTQEAYSFADCDSDTSVMKDKRMSIGTGSGIREEASLNLEGERPLQNYHSQGLYMYSSEDTGKEAAFFNGGVHTQYPSVYTVYERMGSWLLPVQMLHSNENFEDFIVLYREMLNDYYKEAIKFLRLALCSTPPVLAALHPLVQLLLIGDHVDEALDEVEKFCDNDYGVLPFRLRASLLECFDPNNIVKLSTCFEGLLEKDPTCCNSLARLVSFHQTGDYSTDSLLQMIALHLEATCAKYSTWREFALCFLKLFQCEEDQMSVFLDGNQGEQKQCTSISYTTPKIFTEGKSGKAWRLRCKWWLTRHFSNNHLASEISAGDVQLITYKASCASHMYGPEFEYVVKARTFIEKENNPELLLFLQMHMQNSVRIYSNF